MESDCPLALCLVESKCPLVHAMPPHTEQQDIDFKEYVVVEAKTFDFLVFLKFLLL